MPHAVKVFTFDDSREKDMQIQPATSSTHILNPRFLKNTALCDVASTIRQTSPLDKVLDDLIPILPNQRILDPSFLS